MNAIILIREIRRKYGQKVNINQLAKFSKDELINIFNDISNYTPNKTIKKDLNITIKDFDNYLNDCINIRSWKRWKRYLK